VTVRAFQRGLSDHAPLLLDSGEAGHVGNKAPFSLELSWFDREGFIDLIAAEWEKENRGAMNVERWQYKIRHLRQFLHGWAKNASNIYKIEKERLLQLIDVLDIKAESAPRAPAECTAKREFKENLVKHMCEEEIKWAQGAKVRYIREGDNNINFFHLISNGKHQKKKIVQLEQDEGSIVGQEDLKSYISNYYRQLFRSLVSIFVLMDEDTMEDIPQLSPEENDVSKIHFYRRGGV
jgi:hypothetical protein